MTYVLLVVSLVAIIYGANWFVDGAVAVARRLKISDFVIGAVVVGIGTSLPELVVSVKGAIDGNSSVAIGNVVGSNIFNVLAILSLTAIAFPVTITRNNLRKDIPLCLVVSLLLLLLTFNFFNGTTPSLEWYDGLTLLLCFVLFMWMSLRNGKQSGDVPEELADAKAISLGKAIAMIAVGVVVLIVGCDTFVDQAIVIAKRLGVSDAFISITLIACGTSLPELAASVAAALKKNTQLALGNIIGSNIFNISLILGISSQVITLDAPNITIVDYVVMIGAVVLTATLGIRGKLSRLGGVVMFGCFACYLAYLIGGQM